jgi:hypothetical protein
MILWDTWYSERILKVLHTSLHCEYQIAKGLSDLSVVFADCGIW